MTQETINAPVYIPSKEIEEIAKKIANHSLTPYCWQNIIDRLYSGEPLPFKVMPINKP